MKIAVFLLGVAVFASLNATELDQLDPFLSDHTPNVLNENNEGERRIASPEVVLQLKYDRGELDRIYLAQFRKENNAWSPTTQAKVNVCSDLCHAGLGGNVCGVTCKKMLPVGLHQALTEANHTEAEYGYPRTDVCPTLCDNHLGQPLCNCRVAEDVGRAVMHDINWPAVCEAFCMSDGYVLGGCPQCEEGIAPSTSVSSRILSTAEGWTAWCSAQCRQGQGGAACNCDRAPL